MDPGISAQQCPAQSLPRVMFVLPGRGHSGGVRVTVRLATSLLTQGHEVSLAICEPTSLRAQARSVIRRLCTARSAIQPDWVSAFPGRVATVRCFDDLDVARGDVVVAVGTLMAAELVRSSLECVPIRYCHGILRTAGLDLAAAWEGDMATLAVSKTLVPALVNEFRCSHVWVVPNGIDGSEYYEQSGIVRDGIGTIFNSHPVKAPEDTKDVLARCAVQFPLLQIRVFSAEARPVQLRCGEFKQLPSTEAARVIYNQSLIWLMMSREEGFGLPALEAMACGAAVVCTDQLGGRELIEDGRNGLLFPVGDVTTCMKQINRLVSDSGFRLGLVREGRVTARHYTWDAAVTRFRTAVGEIVAAGNCR